jgi:integrase
MAQLLQHKTILHLKPSETKTGRIVKRYVSDGENGRHIKITPNGNKYWVWRFSYRGVRQSPITLHKWHKEDTTAKGRKEANDKIREFEKLLAQDINPKHQILRDKGVPTVMAKWVEWHTTQKPKKNPTEKEFKKQWTMKTWNRADRTMKRHVFPFKGSTGRKLPCNFGEMQCNEITTGILVDLFVGFASKAHDGHDMLETRDLCMSWTNRLFSSIAKQGYIVFNPCLNIDKNELPTTEHEHYATTTDEKGVAMILEKLNRNKRSGWQVEGALNLAFHLMLRPSEVTGLKKSEVLLGERKITIELTRMKKRRIHDVPMSDQVYDLFLDLLKHTESDYVFPSSWKNKNKCIGSDSIRVRLRSSGITKEELVPHGLRAMAASFLQSGEIELDLDDHEEINKSLKVSDMTVVDFLKLVKSELATDEVYDLTVIKKQLSHKIGSKTDQAYLRAMQYQKRKKMLQSWSDILDRIQQKWGDEVKKQLDN